MSVTVESEYDVTLDAKRRLTIRNATTDHFHVTEYKDGSVRLEPYESISPEMLRQIESGVKRHKAGEKGRKLDWDRLPEV